jgi:hypothetical protein
MRRQGVSCFRSLRKTPMDVTRQSAAVIKAPSGHFTQPCHVPRTMTARHIKAISTMSLNFMDATLSSFVLRTKTWRTYLLLSQFPERCQTPCYGLEMLLTILRSTTSAVTTHNAALINAPSGHFSQPCHVPTTTTAMNTKAISTVSLIFMGISLPPMGYSCEHIEARG